VATSHAQQDGDEPEFWLSPFVVESKGDSAYERTRADTATRIAMDLLETPLSVQVITGEFLRDTGRADLVDAFAYSSSIDASPDDVLRNSDIKVRGFGVSFVLRDGFKKYYDAPLDAVDRVEVVKGPNAVFFGQSQPGGVINYVTKDPLFEPVYEFRAEYGQNEQFKVWADATGPLLSNKKLAYRIITSHRDSESWKEGTSWRNDYLFSALKFRPFKRVEVTAKYEYHDGYQTGGINSALVANAGYLADYYANSGRDFGYAVNWATAPVRGATRETGGIPIVRFPWPNRVTPANLPQPPVTGFGGINPRWDGTITPELVAFFNGTVPVEFLSWAQPDQAPFPIYQRNVQQPFQYPMLDINATGTGANFRPGWRMLKFYESGMTEYPGRFTGPIFPRGFNWSPNNDTTFHDTEHHIATVLVTAGITSWLNMRYAGNYLENTFLRVQQHNSDPAMDGSTLFPGLGYGATTVGFASGASVNMFDNKRYTHQLDLTTDLELWGTRHTLLLSGEFRQDKFVNFDLPRTQTYFDTALRVTRFRPDGSPQNFAYLEGVTIYDIFADPPPPIGTWAAINDPRVNLASTNYQEEAAIALSWRGVFLNNRLFTLAGVRWEERSDFVYDGQTIGVLKGARVADTTPMVGINYAIKPELTFYASYSESFVPPARPQGRADVTFFEGPLASPTPVVQPLQAIGVETGAGYEFGLKASGLNGKLSGAATVFHLERSNIVVLDSPLVNRLRQNYLEYNRPWDVSLESGGTAPQTNSGKHTSEGFELDVVYRLRPNWTLTGSFSYLWKVSLTEVGTDQLYGSYRIGVGTPGGPYPHSSLFSNELLGTYIVPGTGARIDAYRPLTPAEIDAAVVAGLLAGREPVNPYTGETLVFEPIIHTDLAQVSKLRFSLWSRYQFSEGRLAGVVLGFGGNYQSKQRPQQTRDLNYWNPGFWTFDAMVNYPVKVKRTDLSLQLNVNNVFDTREIAAGAFGINAPRSWRLSATLKF
jgi:outer membrane receptor protein involved in Fe transport